MKGKWNDNRGETLVEVLASVLICSLSVALLFSMVMASGNMDKSAKEADKIFNESLSAAEERTAVTDETGAVVPPPVSGAEVTVRNTADPDEDFYKAKPPVTFYGGRGAVSYALS